MKIKEITENQNKARVTGVTGNEVEIDQGDGTTLTIDTKKRPDAVARDEQGNLEVDANVGNSAMKTAQQRRRAQAPRPGERIQVKSST